MAVGKPWTQYLVLWNLTVGDDSVWRYLKAAPADTVREGLWAVRLISGSRTGVSFVNGGTAADPRVRPAVSSIHCALFDPATAAAVALAIDDECQYTVVRMF